MCQIQDTVLLGKVEPVSMTVLIRHCSKPIAQVNTNICLDGSYWRWKLPEKDAVSRSYALQQVIAWMPTKFVKEGNRLRSYIAFSIPWPSDMSLTARDRNPACDGGPENMNCCELRLPSKPSGECENDLYVMPSTSSISHGTDKEC